MTKRSVVGRVYEKLTIVAQSGKIFFYFPIALDFLIVQELPRSSPLCSLIFYLYESSKSDNILHNVENEVICPGGLISIFWVCRFFTERSAHHIS